MERTTRFLCDAQMLNVMADGLPGVIAYYDVDFVCHFVNETVEAWTGARPSAYLNKRLGEVAPDFATEARPASSARWPGRTCRIRDRRAISPAA